MRRYAEDNGGWTNYETRAVALWVNNDRGLYGYLQEVVEDMEQEFSGGNLVIRVAGVIQEVLDSMVDELRESGPRSNLLADLLEHSLGQVNFDEIAENFLGY